MVSNSQTKVASPQKKAPPKWGPTVFDDKILNPGQGVGIQLTYWPA